MYLSKYIALEQRGVSKDKYHVYYVEFNKRAVCLVMVEEIPLDRSLDETD